MDYYNHNNNYNNNNNNPDYYISQNAGYYQNNGNFNNKGYDNNSYPRGPLNHLEHVNNNRHPHNPPANYINSGGIHPNGYNNTDLYNSNIKPTSPGGGDSGYSDPHNISSHSNFLYKNQNPHNAPIANRSYNTPHPPPSPIKYPSSPVMPGMNPTYPTYQAPGGRQTDTYNEGALSKEMHSSSMPSGPTNYSQEKPTSPSSAYYSNRPFLDDDDYDDEKKQAKPGGLMKYCCCGRRVSCCRACAIICCILLLLIIGIVAAVLLWARQPKIDFVDIVPSPNNLPAYSASPAGFDFNFGLRIRVDNPNFIGAKFEMIKAVAFYPKHPDPIGGGNMTDLVIAAKGNTTFDFPFSVNYNKDIDPDFSILMDIARRCGLTGEQPQKLDINYKLTVTFKVLLITINPSFDKTANIDCPIKDGKIPNIQGFDINKAAKTFGVSKKKRRDLLTETNIQKNPMLPDK